MRRKTFAPKTLLRRFKYRDLWVYCRGAAWFKDAALARQCAKQLRDARIASNAIALHEDDARANSKSLRICLFVEDDLSDERLSNANEIIGQWRDRMMESAS